MAPAWKQRRVGAPNAAGPEGRPVASELVPTGEFLLYETEDWQMRIERRFADDTLWLPQR